MFKWLNRALWTFAAIGLIGWVYQTIALSRDEGRYHAPGKLIDIGGGRRLHLECRGAGSPTVILASGLGSPEILWHNVMKGVEPTTRVCADDRAGYGYSDARLEPLMTNRIVDDLEKLLVVAGEKGPYLMVGHSLGGFAIRVFASRHRSDVTGLVFVDSSHPEQIARMTQPGFLKKAGTEAVVAALPLFSRLGVVRGVADWVGAPGELKFLVTQPKFARTLVGEWNALAESGAQTAAASPSFGDLPILVLTRGTAGGDPKDYEIWRDQLQPELARLSTMGTRIIVEGSSHMIPTERPQAVIDAIRQLLEQKPQR